MVVSRPLHDARNAAPPTAAVPGRWPAAVPAQRARVEIDHDVLDLGEECQHLVGGPVAEAAGLAIGGGRFVPVAGRIVDATLHIQSGLGILAGEESVNGWGEFTCSRRRGLLSSPRLAGALHFAATPAGVAKWQTQRTQNAPPERACGFESRPRHPSKSSTLLSIRSNEMASLRERRPARDPSMGVERRSTPAVATAGRPDGLPTHPPSRPSSSAPGAPGAVARVGRRPLRPRRAHR